MKTKRTIAGVTLAAGLYFIVSCGANNSSIDANKNAANPTVATNAASPTQPLATTIAPLPDGGFKAQLSLPNAPTKLKAGEKTIIKVHVKNTGNAVWRAGGLENGKFAIAVGNIWRDANDKFITELDGRHGIVTDLAPGAEGDVPVQITAPKTPGNYILELDMVQEQVAWFHEKGSPTFKTKLIVEK